MLHVAPHAAHGPTATRGRTEAWPTDWLARQAVISSPAGQLGDAGCHVLAAAGSVPKG